MTPLSSRRLGLACLLFATAVTSSWAQIFPGADRLSLVIKNDATINGAHIALGGLFGGDLNLTGNIEFGNRLGAGELGLYVGDTLTANGNQVALFNTDAYVAATAGSVTFQNPGLMLSSDPLPMSVTEIFNALENESANFASLSSNAAVAQASYSINGNQMTISTHAGQLNALNLSDATAQAFLANQNGNIIVNGLSTAGTQLVINTNGAAGSTLNFNTKTNSVSQSQASNVVWNFSGFSTLAFGSSADTFRGTIFAPESAVEWRGNDIDGQVFASSYSSSQSREVHDVVYHIEFPPIPEPSTFGLAALGMLGFAAATRRRRVVAI